MRARAADGQGQPARERGPALSGSARAVRLAFAGTPSAAVPSLRALLDSPAARGRRGRSPGRRRAPAAAGSRRRRRSPSWPPAAGLPVLTPARARASRSSWRELRRPRRRLLPGRRLRRAAAAGGAGRPAHGWVNLHFSLLPAWRGAAPVQHAILHGDDDHRRVDVPDRGRPRHRPGVRRRHRDDPPRRHGRRPARRGWRVSGAGAAAARRWTASRTARCSRARSRPTASRSRRRSRVADAASTGRARRSTSTGWSGPAPRHPARGHVPRRAAQARPGPAARRRRRWRRGSSPSTRSGVAVGTATTDVELGTVQPPGKRPMPAADWARGARLEPGERLG